MAEGRVAQLVVAILFGSAIILAGWGVYISALPIVGVTTAVTAMALGAFIAPAVSSGNRLPLTIAVAAALPFVFTAGEGVDLPTVVGVYLAGSVVLAAINLIRREQFLSAVGFAGRHFLGYTAYVVILASVQQLVGSSLGTSGWEILVPFAAGAVAWVAVEFGLWSLLTSGQVSTRYLTLAAMKDLNVFVSLVATGGLFGLMYEALGWWALPVALLPYSFAHGAFRRFQETKVTYRQTIRALARIPEAAGFNLTGHADRTAELSVAMAKDLGLTPEDVEDVEFVGLMHDIGRITLNEPSVVEQGWSDDDLARWGAEIIAGAPSLDRVAGYVRRQYEPFRNPGEESDPTLSPVARIVKIASAYDADRMGKGLSKLEALEQLHQGAAYEYDPEVVASLRRILEGSSTLSA